MKWKRLLGLAILTLFIMFFLNCSEDSSTEPSDDPQTVLSVTLKLTVDGSIQTDDPWTTGDISVNEWAKPMYRIWLDLNGNPDDGPYGNGAGTRQVEVWLDTGRLGFRWYGPDGTYGTGDDVEHWPVISTISTSYQTEEDVTAKITDGGSTLEVYFPLEKIDDPETMEAGFMASPWTTSASDNLGQGAGSASDYIVVSDATQDGTHTQSDQAGDNIWPGLSPNHEDNFDIIEAQVIIGDK
jgi:hypothetical protein